MAKAGSCFFRIGYFLYSRTKVGYYYHQRDIAKAKEKLLNVGGNHSNITPFKYGGKQGENHTLNSCVPYILFKFKGEEHKVKSTLCARGLQIVHECIPCGQFESPTVVKGLTDLQMSCWADLEIVPIPMLLDNYAYLVTDHRTGSSVVVDPGHAEPVQVLLSSRNIMPEAVLVTHKHWDHSGGNKDMKQHYPKLRVYGSHSDHVPDITHTVQDGETLVFGELKFRTMFTPGHTTGHMVYILDGSPYGVADSVFSGDLLFLSGCGRIFEGTAANMLQSLDLIYSLPESTFLWPGHEYARENLEFTCNLDPENTTSKEKLEWVKSQREKRLCTCPSTVQEEKQYNPFMRTWEESMARNLGLVKDGIFATPDNALRARMLMEMRERKDQFCYKL